MLLKDFFLSRDRAIKNELLREVPVESRESARKSFEKAFKKGSKRWNKDLPDFMELKQIKKLMKSDLNSI